MEKVTEPSSAIRKSQHPQWGDIPHSSSLPVSSNPKVPHSSTQWVQQWWVCLSSILTCSALMARCSMHSPSISSNSLSRCWSSGETSELHKFCPLLVWYCETFWSSHAWKYSCHHLEKYFQMSYKCFSDWLIVASVHHHPQKSLLRVGSQLGRSLWMSLIKWQANRLTLFNFLCRSWSHALWYAGKNAGWGTRIVCLLAFRVCKFSRVICADCEARCSGGNNCQFPG